MLYVVTGPPGAGKSSWIRAHAKAVDVVIDFDLLALALSGPGAGDRAYTRNLEKVVHKARWAAIREAETLLDKTDVYLINTSPSPRDRANYKRLGAEIITVDPGRDIVMRRIADMRQPGMAAVAERWYKKHRTTRSRSAMPQASRPW
ncbi:AAA family ATPase [Streptomyces sp. NPDC055025]